jgi:hypothetical protein
MSPELFDSEAQVHRRTEKSDCYALGMVIYEVLSRREPFYRYAGPVVIGKVAKGERPERPQGLDGAAFTDGIWKLLGLCWAPLPQDRPSVQDALKCLEEAASSWTPPPPPSMVVPSEVNSPTWSGFYTASEQSVQVDESGVPPPSHSSDKPPRKRGADDIYPPAHGFSLFELSGHQAPGAETRSPDERRERKRARLEQPQNLLVRGQAQVSIAGICPQK